MQYRKMGNTGVEVSALGFGCMRLPINEDKTINEEKAIAMIRHAIDNYVDTAYPYHQGTSELVVGKALQDGYREKVYLADKMPMNVVSSAEHFDEILDEQLAKCGTDHFDFFNQRESSFDFFTKHLIHTHGSSGNQNSIDWLFVSFHGPLSIE